MLQKNLKKIILYGLPIFYFLIAVCFYLGTYDSAQIKITILHVGGLFLIMTWLLLKIEEGNFNFFNKKLVYIFPVLLFLLSGTVSFFISPLKLASFNELVKRFIYCGLVFILVSEFDDNKKILRIKDWLIIASYIVCLYGLLQIIDYYFFPAPPTSGLDPFGWRQAFGKRIMSTFGNPNFFGDFLIVMSPIILSLFVYKRKFYLAFLWILIAICAYQTISKGAWLGFAVGFFVFAIIYIFIFLKHKFNRKILISAVIGTVFVLCAVMFGIYHQMMGRTDSASFRIFTWLSTWEMINTNPVLGTGVGTFYLTYPAWRRPQIFFIEGKHNTESDHPENEYLEVWYDEGMIGLTILLVLFILVFVAGYKNILFLRSIKDVRDGYMPYVQLGVISAFVAQAVHDCVCVSLRFVSSGVMLWLLIGITLSISANFLKDRNTKEKDFLKRPIKIILHTIVVAVFGYAIFFLTGYFIADRLHSQAIGFSKGGNWDAAITTYDKVNKQNPSYPMSIYFKANVHVDRWKAGDPIIAERTFKKLWDIAPNYVQSKYLAATMYAKLWDTNRKLKDEYVKLGKPSEVIAQHDKAIIDAYYNAVKYYKQYIEIDPIYLLTYYGLASLYARTGNFGEAEKILFSHLEYPKNLQNSPHNFWVEDWSSRRKIDYSETYSQLGNLYLLQDKIEAARDAYLKALELSPQHVFVKKNLSIVYAKLGDNAKSNQQWIEVYQIDPNDADAKAYLQSIGVIPKN
ncbi:MAG: O-antigen ligase family protein [Endomicrobium sp.]|jgi:O-antigen ligase/tetratricopeptide (TPR) repeat protein|nr:O-antigen ligase family protein [Endomicrobium sp.]